MGKAHNLLVLTGPSCLGKRPLVRTLRKFHPADMEAMRPLVLYNRRFPRPGERDAFPFPIGEARLALQRVRDDFFGTGALESWSPELFGGEGKADGLPV